MMDNIPLSKMTPHEREIHYLRTEIAKTKSVLGTLISWVAQSANSPLSQNEAVDLLKKLEYK